MKKLLVVICMLFILIPSTMYAANNKTEGLWVRNWVGVGETQHWTDITDMLIGGSTFTETDPLFEAWKNSEYRDEQDLQWSKIQENLQWNAYQQGQINYLSHENSQQWRAITGESLARQYHDQLLNNKINIVDYKSEMRDLYLNNKIDAETYQRMISDQFVHEASIQRDNILDNKIQNESIIRQYYDQLLDNKIDITDYKSKVRDLYLDNRIDAETYQRVISDQFIHNASIQRDNILDDKIHNESIARQYYDQLLHGEITETDYKSKARDAWLNNKINSETYDRMIADETIHNASVQRDNQLRNLIGTVDNASFQRDMALNDMIMDNRRRIDDNSNRIKDLEDPKFNVIGAIRFYDDKKWQINGFAAYDVTNDRLDKYGLQFTFKLGPSYEERLIEELKAKIAALEANLNTK